MSSITIPEDKLDKFLFTFKQTLGYLLEAEIVKKCPVDNGFLRNSINFEITGEGIKISMADYGVYVEYGTAPHIIRPKTAKALAFKGKNGKTVFAKQVNHPGTNPQPFIRPALFKLPQFVEQAATYALQEVST